MNNVTNGNRKAIGIFGSTNAGKSSLMNLLTGQESSIVSDVNGTTTDTVKKAMEILELGAVNFIDTAGINDESSLGEKRIEKTMQSLKSCDLALYILDATNIDLESLEIWEQSAKKYNVDYKIIINKIDLLDKENFNILQEKFKGAIFVSAKGKEYREKLLGPIKIAIENIEEDKSLIGDILPYGSKVILVVPIDSEAPKGRLILPQVQLIRDCLDNGIKSYVVRDTELEAALSEMPDVDLVITDSQAFKKVAKIVPSNIKLTSFSILFSRQKGDLKEFIDGVNNIRNLKNGSKILMAESCTHNVSHEDIGQVKIPMMLRKYTGLDLEFDFSMGNDFKKNINDYDLVIHCGACMINRKTVLNRIAFCKEHNVPIANYGMVIAFVNGILDRATNIF
ncbi:MAG: [FeFe] hydrogenase H-cluster maturation GTPase HydF [Sarcina sp.]